MGGLRVLVRAAARFSTFAIRRGRSSKGIKKETANRWSGYHCALNNAVIHGIGRRVRLVGAWPVAETPRPIFEKKKGEKKVGELRKPRGFEDVARVRRHWICSKRYSARRSLSRSYARKTVDRSRGQLFFVA